MDICLNNDFEGNIIEIPGNEEDPNIKLQRLYNRNKLRL